MSTVIPLNYSVAEAADVLGIGVTLMRKLVRDGAVPSHKFGRRRLIPAAQLERFNAEHAAIWREEQRTTGDDLRWMAS